MKKNILIIFCCFLLIQPAFSYRLSEQARIFLLTCQPGTNVYSTFGHTALHVQDELQNLDIVFNYGIFSFAEPNFLFRFIKGHTYYLLGIQDYNDFLADYRYDLRGVYSQELNLTHEEKNRLFDALLINHLPENRRYLYNFFFDNCSTRPRDIIESNISGVLIYPQWGKTKTFRDLIAEYTGRNTWLKFGIDILIGTPADKIISDFEKMFLPDYLKKTYAKTYIKRNGELQPLVRSSEQVVANFPRESPSFLLSPAVIMTLFLILTIAISTYDIKRRRRSYWFDFSLFFILGLIGIIVAFVSFFSIHPAVFPNYNILWLHPLHIIFAICLLIKPLRERLKYYHYFNFLMIVTAIILSFFAQTFNFAFYPLMIAIAIRSKMLS